VKTSTFESVQEIAVPLATVFPFFADPRNLETITPPWLQFRILTPGAIQMRPGALIDYRIRIRGIPVRWRTGITVWDPPHRFVDRQIRGPYRLWVHEHTFSEENGATKMRDRVEYAVPGGEIIRRLLVAPDVERIFRYRRAVLERVFANREA
jgi:ligand-binding SRPBCC domain-containing protein